MSHVDSQNTDWSRCVENVRFTRIPSHSHQKTSAELLKLFHCFNHGQGSEQPSSSYQMAMKTNARDIEACVDEPTHILETETLMVEYDRISTGSNEDTRRSFITPSLLLFRSHFFYYSVILALVAALMCCFSVIFSQQHECHGDIQTFYYYCNSNQ